MAEPLIVRAEEAHLDAIEALERMCFAMPWSRAALYEDICVNQSIYYVALLAGELIGYAGMWPILDEGHITNLCVHPMFRRQGIAATLLQALVSYAKENALTAMTLEVRVSNEGAIQLYERFGFTIEGRRRKYYANNREDAYIMWKHGVQ